MKSNNLGTGVKQNAKSRGANAKWSTIDKGDFESLCELQCTLAEIAGFFKVDVGTVRVFCKATYGMGFKDCFTRYGSKGHISVRRAQYLNATEHNNPIMQIWLGKQFLGQKDKMEQTNVDKIEFVNDVPDGEEDEDEDEDDVDYEDTIPEDEVDL